MKIYFVGSISGRKKYLGHYRKIIECLRNNSHIVYEDTLRPTENEVFSLSDDKKVEYYKQVLSWITQADVVVAEATYSSMGVGQEITTALQKGKSVVVMYEEGHAPHFLEGITSEKLIIERYNLENVESVLKSALSFASTQQDTRFNFFVPPRIASYLDWVAIKKRVPRAVYLRGLILKEMEGDSEFQGEKK